jgi:catechol 2,3-dioxygenase-like lactoylglutathione lyase family enzyme
MKLLAYLFSVFALLSTCSAELPGYYKTVSRVTWVVRDVEHVKQGWIALGLSDVHDYGEIKLTGQFRGRPVVISGRRVTGQLGNLIVEMIQPEQGQRNAFTEFLVRHGDGIFAVVHEVPSKEAMDDEVRRMRGLGVNVLQNVVLGSGQNSVTFTYFDTEPKGKFVLGLVYSPSAAATPSGRDVISHLAPVVREWETVEAFWESLGFPAFKMEHATPREDSRYRGKPLLLAFDVGFQHGGPIGYEWIVPPATPLNIYADFLQLHGEGIQHLGIPVDDLRKAVAEYEKLGYQVWQSGAWGDVGKKNSGQYDYMDTDSIGGVSVELIHAY